MKSENFVVIQGWMCNELELKGNELLVFALIHGFSQDAVSKFNGGRKYISETFNISLPTVDKALQNLLEKGYIKKFSSDDFVNADNYWVNDEVVKKLYEGSKETLLGGSKETLHNNIINKNKKVFTKVNTTTSGRTLFEQSQQKKPNQFQKCMQMINDFTDDANLQFQLHECFKLFNENARESNTPFYSNTFKGKLNKLKSLSDDVQEQIQICLQTLDNGWNSFYALKKDKYNSKVSSDMGFETKRGDKEALKEAIANGKAEKF